MNEGQVDGLDQSYDHLLKGDQRKEESKLDNLCDNEELKEGFIGDLNGSYSKDRNLDELEQFILDDVPKDRTRVKTAFQSRQMGTTLGEVNKSHDGKIHSPMVNKLYEETQKPSVMESDNREVANSSQAQFASRQRSNLDLELQALVSESDAPAEPMPEEEAQELS